MRLVLRERVEGIVSILYADRGALTGTWAVLRSARGRTAHVAMAERRERARNDFILVNRRGRMNRKTR
jgi:hypothetical protein